MTTRNNTLNFGDKSCKTIHGEKTTLRIINILTRKITICFKKNTQISKIFYYVGCFTLKSARTFFFLEPEVPCG